ncbi:tRNA pseudouridine(55) synthase TruB [Halotalea alkalilenta]|uniref:tRNA pseudouridine synthase B n=1 Tax=Halotalea alkalilenta TaxID=376489 RepID=A0A172YA12_9GAMM|nr:tRNA pseudouridine(55) synthase TruB [Halotalea alkalilenta]ANF56069.1 tRNA pseudouridine(55) synthase TruB [Halotalea alkalilenta]
MAKRRRGRPVDGVLLLDKPKGLSSNRALQRARGIFQAAKAGHTGTLDPMATGLLPICFGEATKFSSFALDADKRYLARVQLGITTDSGDAEGVVLEERPVPALDEAGIECVLARFRGEIEQIPPMFSALKHQGRPLYELAREGREIERAPRRVTIYHMRLVSLDADAGWFDLEVDCSKGTYIRTLGMDIGAALGCGAHLSALRRLRTGPFEASAMVGLDALEALGEERDVRLLPVDALIAHLPRLETDEPTALLLNQGRRIRCATGSHAPGTMARLYCDERLLGLVTVTEEGELAPRRLLRDAANG